MTAAKWIAFSIVATIAVIIAVCILDDDTSPTDE